MGFCKKSLAYLALATAITACNDGKGPGNPDAYQGKQGGGAGNECTQQFVSEYNEVARTARYVQSDLQLSDTPANRAQTRSDAQALKDKASAFKSKYAGVACVAKIDEARETIDVNPRMDVAIQAATSVLANLDKPATGRGTSTGRPTQPGPEQCSSAFVNQYLDVTSYAKTVADDLDLPDTAANRAKTKADAETLKTQARTFKARHAGYKCDVGTGSSRYSIDVDVKMTELIETAESVISILDNGGSARPAAALLAPTELPSVLPIQLIGR